MVILNQLYLFGWSLTDPGVMEFFKLFLTILQVLNKAVLENRKSNIIIYTIHLLIKQNHQHKLLLEKCMCTDWYLILQGGHAFLQMELQPLIGFGEQTIDGVWQALVVLFVHLLSLTSLMSREGNPWSRGIVWHMRTGCFYDANPDVTSRVRQF